MRDEFLLPAANLPTTAGSRLPFFCICHSLIALWLLSLLLGKKYIYVKKTVLKTENKTMRLHVKYKHLFFLLFIYLFYFPLHNTKKCYNMGIIKTSLVNKCWFS